MALDLRPRLFIFPGANPATLPVEVASRYEPVINAKAAETLGLVIPHAEIIG